MTAEERLQELRQYAQFGGLSASYAGSMLFESLSSGMTPGAGGPKFAGLYGGAHAVSRLGETARAVLSLPEEARETIAVVYFDDLPNQEQQSCALGIKPRALRDRLHRIHLALEDWWSVAAKTARAIAGKQAADRAAEAESDAHATAVRMENLRREEEWNRHATSPARLTRLARQRKNRETGAEIIS